MKPPLLRVSDLVTEFHARHGVVHAVNGVSFDMEPGERLAIVGESGSGKSAMAQSLLRLLPAAGKIVGGRVELDGQDLLTMNSKGLAEVRGGRVAMVFQDPMMSLNPVMTIKDQMIPPMRQHLGLSTQQAVDRAIELLGQVGIPDPASRLRAHPHELSGGMRQRVLIAMALSCKPELIIADEPTTALDVTIQAQIVALLKHLSEQTGTAVLFITHDFGLVARFAQKIAVMYGGRMVEFGKSVDVFGNPQHPYTRALLRSIPAIAGPKPDRLEQIDGAPPNMKALIPGCSFMPRCDLATAACGTRRPLLNEFEPGHSAACFETDAASREVLVAAV